MALWVAWFCLGFPWLWQRRVVPYADARNCIDLLLLTDVKLFDDM